MAATVAGATQISKTKEQQTGVVSGVDISARVGRASGKSRPGTTTIISRGQAGKKARNFGLLRLCHVDGVRVWCPAFRECLEQYLLVNARHENRMPRPGVGMQDWVGFRLTIPGDTTQTNRFPVDSRPWRMRHKGQGSAFFHIGLRRLKVWLTAKRRSVDTQFLKMAWGSLGCAAGE